MIPITKIALKQEFTGDRQTNQIQTNAYDSGKVINAFPMAFGRMLEDETDANNPTTFLTFTAGQSRTFSHKLKRAATGFVVVDASGTAGYPSIRRAISTDQATERLFITLQSANACTVKVWVY